MWPQANLTPNRQSTEARRRAKDCHQLELTEELKAEFLRRVREHHVEFLAPEGTQQRAKQDAELALFRGWISEGEE